MIINAQNWRKTVNEIGLDKLYSEMDPLDVCPFQSDFHKSRYQLFFQYPERKAVFDCWPLYFHKTDKVSLIISWTVHTV